MSIGSAVGCTVKLESEYLVLSDSGREWVVDHGYTSPHLYDYYMPGSIATEVAWAVNAQGPVAMVSAGMHVRAWTPSATPCDLIREGIADVMLAGGDRGPRLARSRCPALTRIKATSNRGTMTPRTRCGRSTATRNGFVLGEGAAMLVLEELQAARARDAKIYAEITGYAYRTQRLSHDRAETGRRRTGRRRRPRRYGPKARVGPREAVDYVNAHGTATKQNDKHETAAIKTVPGRPGLPRYR